jgi:SAM-dependent methyltransferase
MKSQTLTPNNSIVTVPACAVCGSSRIAAVLTRSVSEFLGSRVENYRLDRLGLDGSEKVGYARCLTCSFMFASPTLDDQYEHAAYNDAKEGRDPRHSEWARDADVRNLYETYHKWADLHPFMLGLGFQTMRYDRPRNYGNKPLRLLDVGCGYGHTLEIARLFGVEAEGCDLDASRLAACRDKGLQVCHPHEIKGAFDVILSSNVIEHVFDVHDYTAMVARHLAERGVFVFNGLDKSVIRVELRKKAFKLLHPIEHRNIFTHRSLTRLLRDHGLRLADRGEVITVMKRLRSRAPMYLPYLIRGGFVSFNGVFSAIARRR